MGKGWKRDLKHNLDASFGNVWYDGYPEEPQYEIP